MGESIDFIHDRAKATHAAQAATAANWESQEWSLDQQNQDLAAFEKLRDREAKEDQIMRDARGSMDDNLDALHRRTMQGLAMLKTRLREQPGKLSVLAPLTADGNSRSKTRDEAKDWAAAWTQLDPAWAPTPVNTLKNFEALRAKDADPNAGLEASYKAQRSVWRDTLGELNGAHDLYDKTVAWYADATRVFPAGTPHGDMIRATVPTTYNPPPDAKPPAPPPAP